MPPKKTAAVEDDGSVVTFTESEVKFIKAVFDNFKSRPDVDFDKVADVLGLANAKSARDRFRVISKKHGWGSTDGSAGASTSSAKGKGKGALAAKNNSKVTKKAATKKKGTAQKKKAKEVEEESDADEDVSAKLESDSDGKTAKDENMDDESE